MLHRVSCPTGGARPRQADPRSVTADVNQVNGPNSPGIQLIGRNAPKTPNTRIRRRKPQQRAPGHVQPPSRTRPVTCWPNSTGSPSSSRGSSRRSNVALSHPGRSTPRMRNLYGPSTVHPRGGPDRRRGPAPKPSRRASAQRRRRRRYDLTTSASRSTCPDATGTYTRSRCFPPLTRTTGAPSRSCPTTRRRPSRQSSCSRI